MGATAEDITSQEGVDVDKIRKKAILVIQKKYPESSVILVNCLNTPGNKHGDFFIENAEKLLKSRKAEFGGTLEEDDDISVRAIDDFINQYIATYKKNEKAPPFSKDIINEVSNEGPVKVEDFLAAKEEAEAQEIEPEPEVGAKVIAMDKFKEDKQASMQEQKEIKASILEIRKMIKDNQLVAAQSLADLKNRIDVLAKVTTNEKSKDYSNLQKLSRAYDKTLDMLIKK